VNVTNRNVPQVCGEWSQKKQMNSPRFDGNANDHDETTEAENSTGDEDEGPQPMNQFWKSSAFWTAIFTGLLCIFTYLLYEVSKESTETSKEQAKAVVSFGGFAMGPAINDQNGWMGQQFQINWFNNGLLPGKTATFQQGLNTFYGDLPKTYDFPLEGEKIQGIVPPRGQFSTFINIPKTQLEDAWRGKAKLFVWGTVVYKDGFADDPIRVSEFCSDIQQITVGYTTPQPALPATAPSVPQAPTKMPSFGDPNTGIISISWRSCNRGAHSCYDQDCSDYKEQIKNFGQ
jgi:hypothetical protein